MAIGVKGDRAALALLMSNQAEHMAGTPVAACSLPLIPITCNDRV